MKRFWTISSALSIAAFVAAAHAAQVYKWIDEEGITHYGEQAPADYEYELVTTSGAPPADAEKAKARLQKMRAAREEQKEKTLDYAAQQKQRDEEAKIRTENCDSAKSNLKTIEENARVRVLGEDGEFRYLSEEERQQQIDRAKEIISNNCDA